MNKKVLKILILGDAGVGKTAILDRYVNLAFTGMYKVTIGANFLVKDLYIDDKRVKLQIWDTAGQEKYRSLAKEYYRGSDACLYVFDVTCRNTFDDLKEWDDVFREQLPEDRVHDFPIAVLGNKADLTDRAVPADLAKKWCHDHGDLSYFETSAKANLGLDGAFEYIARQALQQLSSLGYADVSNQLHE